MKTVVIAHSSTKHSAVRQQCRRNSLLRLCGNNHLVLLTAICRSTTIHSKRTLAFPQQCYVTRTVSMLLTKRISNFPYVSVNKKVNRLSNLLRPAVSTPSEERLKCIVSVEMSPRATYYPRHSVMLPAETFQLRLRILTVPLTE